jgi:hypothetical protein
VYTVRFRFEHDCLTCIEQEQDGQGRNTERPVCFQSGSFARKDSTLDLAESMKGGDNESMSDSAKEAMNMIKAFMGDIKVMQIYHLPKDFLL